VVEGDLLLVNGCGGQERPILAFDRKTGRLKWSSHTGHPGYSSPIVVSSQGVRQAIFFTGTSIASVSPADGKVFWTYHWRTNDYENVATPVFIAQDKIFFSSAHPHEMGAAVLQIKTVTVQPRLGRGLHSARHEESMLRPSRSRSGWMAEQLLKTKQSQVKVEPLWKSHVMQHHFSSSVLYEGFLYGTDRAILKCIEASTGREIWKQRGFGEGSLIFADGHLFVLSTSGTLALVEATPAAYREKARAQILTGKCYTAPSLAAGKLYLRNESEMVCLDLTGERSSD
jgi:outer membrane protein assembly factor BamB